MELVKAPKPEPSDVFVVNATVGLALVPQTTPLAVTEASPSTVTFPPPEAPVGVIEDTVVDVTVGAAPVLIFKVAMALPDAL
jgi:hypothetical protein